MDIHSQSPLVNVVKQGLQKKTTEAERKRLKRKIQTKCRDEINAHLQKADAIHVLAEGQSISSYKRMRLAQSFETPEQKANRSNSVRKRKHSPRFENAIWDKEQVLADLRSWPTGKVLNWTQFAKEHNVPGHNAGQVVKEFATECGIARALCTGGGQ